MCGRYNLNDPAEDVAAVFALAGVPDLRPRYNVAPSQLVAVVGRRSDGTRALAMFRWGFVPRTSPTANPKVRPINARAESVALREPFRESFRDRRCLLPASGFYEWATEGGKKVPHHFRHRPGGRAAAGGDGRGIRGRAPAEQKLERPAAAAFICRASCRTSRVDSPSDSARDNSASASSGGRAAISAWVVKESLSRRRDKSNRPATHAALRNVW